VFALYSKQRSEEQRRVPATPEKFFVLSEHEPFQVAATLVGQAHEPPVPFQRSSADVDLNCAQDAQVHRTL
jgi:hypothetical protein